MAMRCLIGLPGVIVMFATTLLNISSCNTIKLRIPQNPPSPNQPLINNIIWFHFWNNSPRSKCLETSIRSTTISTTLFVIMVSVILGGLFGISPYFLVALTSICINSVRVPLLILLAFNKDETNAFKSRAQRQEWEMKNALEERQRRSEANTPTNIQIETAT